MKQLLIILVICSLISGTALAAGTGRLVITMRAGGSAEDLTVHLIGFAGVDDVQVLPDGTAEIQVKPGTYVGYLENGNGGQLEQQTATVTAGETSYLSFLGHAVATSRYHYCRCWEDGCDPDPVPTPTPTPVPTVTPTPAPTPPVCEQVHYPEVNHTVWHPEHIEHVYKTWVSSQDYLVYYYPWTDGECSFSYIPWFAPDGEEGLMWCLEQTAQAWSEVVIDSPARTETVCPEVFA